MDLSKRTFAELVEEIKTVSAYAISNEPEFIEKVRAASEVRQVQAVKELKRKLNSIRTAGGPLSWMDLSRNSMNHMPRAI